MPPAQQNGTQDRSSGCLTCIRSFGGWRYFDAPYSLLQVLTRTLYPFLALVSAVLRLFAAVLARTRYFRHASSVRLCWAYWVSSRAADAAALTATSIRWSLVPASAVHWASFVYPVCTGSRMGIGISARTGAMWARAMVAAIAGISFRMVRCYVSVYASHSTAYVPSCRQYFHVRGRYR